MRALLRRIRMHLRSDVRYDLLDDLVLAIGTHQYEEEYAYAWYRIKCQMEADEMLEADAYFAERDRDLAEVTCSHCGYGFDDGPARCDCIESQCVQCGCHGIWSLKSNICPSCQHGTDEDAPTTLAA